MESVYKEIPMECLPREYLPDDYHGPCAGTMDELIRKSLLHGARSQSRKMWLHRKWNKPDVLQHIYIIIIALLNLNS